MKDVVFDCPKCGQLLEAPEDMVEFFVECPKCGEVIQVPAGKPVEPAPASRKEDPDASRQDALKSATIKIELPPNLGVPQAPKRRITIRRKS